MLANATGKGPDFTEGENMYNLHGLVYGEGQPRMRTRQSFGRLTKKKALILGI